MIAPIIDELAVEYAGRIKVAKIDTDAQQGLAAQYGILSIPAVMLFKDGRPVEQVVGARPKAALVSALHLDQHVAAPAG
jgi:thioredoxin 1